MPDTHRYENQAAKYARTGNAPAGDAEQWRRVRRGFSQGGASARRAAAATRDARLFGTDPSWFGF